MKVNLRYLSGSGQTEVDGWDTYSPTSVTFAVGETSKSVRYRLISDAVPEADETIVLEAYDVSGAAVLAGNANVLRSAAWILDDDGGNNKRALYGAGPVLSESAAEAVFNVSLSRPAQAAFSVSYRTIDGSARAGSDYKATSGNLSFVEGQSVAQVRVPLIANYALESTETFTLSFGASASLGAASSIQARILDNSIQGTSIGEELKGTPGAEPIYGLAGNDSLYGFAGNDRLDGGNGNDRLYGGAGRDLMFGGNGNDLLNGGGWKDDMRGGAGNDVYVVDNAGDKVVEAARQGVDRVESAVSYRLAANVENLTLLGRGDLRGDGNGSSNVLRGNSGDNVLTGANGGDALYGNNGNDRLYGGNGNDRLYGGVGRDLMVGGNGNDLLNGGGWKDDMRGGAGNDVYVVDSAGDKVVEAARQGVDRVESSVSYRLASTLENLTLLGRGDLRGDGNGTSNVIRGNSGDNVLTGANGNDTLLAIPAMTGSMAATATTGSMEVEAGTASTETTAMTTSPATAAPTCWSADAGLTTSSSGRGRIRRARPGI